MIKKIFALIAVIFINISVIPEEIILDDVSSDGKGNYAVTIHNLDESGVDNLKLTLDGKDYTGLAVEKMSSKFLFGVIIDNSGSMKLDDFFTLLKRMNYILDNMKEDDYIAVWKLNDRRIPIYPLGRPDKNFSVQINKLIREGKYTRLYDGIIESKKELDGYMQKEEYRTYFPSLVVLSDADDINSANKPGDILTENNDIPFYFFSYLTLPDKRITEPYEKLSGITKGKFLERPDEQAVKKYLFDRNTRYLVKFVVKKSDFKKETVTAQIKDEQSDTLTFELKNLFNGNNGNNVNSGNIKNIDDKNGSQDGFHLPFKIPFKILLYLVMILVTLFILLLVFFLMRKKFLAIGHASKERMRSSGGSGTSFKNTTNSGYDSNDAGVDKTVENGQNLQSTGTKFETKSGKSVSEEDTEEMKKPEDLKTEKEQGEQKTDVKKQAEVKKQSDEFSAELSSDGKTSPFLKNQKIIYRETEDLLNAKKYNKIHLFHNDRTTFVDAAETSGQEVYYNTRFALKKVTAEFLVCSGKMFLLLDEILKINGIQFRVIAVTVEKRKKLLNYKIVPLEKLDLVKKFSKKKEIEASKKSLIFGTPDSILEKMTSRKTNGEIVFSGEWKKAEIIGSSDNTVKIATNSPVVIDTCIEFKTEVSSLKKINARIISAEMINKDYFFTVELTK
jgi:hypothetical protein